ncbi:MAG: hypothetical protein WC262_09540 [Bacteroidales bacterium]|jgi:hypothetical protein
MPNSKLVFTVGILTVLAMVFVAGCTSSSSSGPSTDTAIQQPAVSTTAPKVTATPTVSTPTLWVGVVYPGDWQGSILVDGSQKSMAGSGVKTFTLPDDARIVSVSAQKMDGSDGVLMVSITKNGKTVASEITDAPYGVVTVAELV